MLKTATLTIAVGAMTALFVLPAGASPLAPLAQQTGIANILTLVADGCGRGNVRIKGECYREVKEEDDEDRPRRRARSDDDDDDQPRRHSRNRDDDDDHECRRGFHFSERRGHCVENPSAGEVLLKAIIRSGNNRHHGNNNQHQGNNQGKAHDKAACKPEPGCPCVNGRHVCH